MAHNNRGEALRELNRMKEAVDAYKEALAIEEKLVADFESVISYRQDLGMTYNNLGELLTMMGRYDDAKAAFEKAIPIREKLAREFSTNKTYAVELGGCYAAMGNVVHFGGEPEAALAGTARARQDRARAGGREAAGRWPRRFAATAYGARAMALEKLPTRYAEAVKDCDRRRCRRRSGETRKRCKSRATLLARSNDSVPPIPTESGGVDEQPDQDDPTDAFP